MSLPPPSDDQAYCNVSALEAGHIELALEMFINPATPGSIYIPPSLAFLIQHSKSRKNFVFDLGIRRDWENYPPSVVQRIKTTFPVNVPQDVVESLKKGGLSPSEISTVCLSHCHFDHVGDTRPFVDSTFIVGAASSTLFKPGFPTDPNAGFASDLLPAGRTEFLSVEAWEPLGPFPRALDFYGDGSLYIIDSPGHLPGHINALVRTSADGGWIYLAGDSAHHWSLVTGEAKPAMDHRWCVHIDAAAAEEHIARIRPLMKIPRVRVVLGHDEPWYKENKDGPAFWPGQIESL